MLRGIDLLAAGLPPIPSAFLRGEHLDLLAPLRFVDPGTRPAAAAPLDRTALAAALATDNAAYGHPAATDLAARLAAPETAVIVTGQQPGLFGGPILTLSKMVAAVRWAESLEAAGIPAVAVFWVATEDHDWAEVAQATVSGPRGPETLALGDDPAPLMPVGMRSFGDGLDGALAQARELYPGDLTAAAWDGVARHYRPDARFGEAFCRFCVDLLGARAPLMLDAMNAEVKQLQRPHLRRLVERRVELDGAQQAADAAITSAGFPLQVTPQPGTSPLFMLHGQARRRIVWSGEDRFALRGLEGSDAPVASLLAAIDDNPSVVSPGVLARPAIQDALLGTTLQVLGPGEMSYMPQVAPTYGILGIPAPATTLRPQVVLVEQRQARQLQELGIDLGDLVDQSLDGLLASRLGEDLVGPARAQVAEILTALGDPIRALDPTLDRPRTKTADQIDRALGQLARKVDAAVARKHDTWRKRLERIVDAVRPDGAWQERRLSTAHLAVRLGPPAVTALFDQMDLDPRRLQPVIV